MMLPWRKYSISSVGFELKGQTLSGEQVISELPDVTEDPVDAYSYQIAMLQSACKQFAQVASNADLSQVQFTLILAICLPTWNRTS